MLFRSAVPPYSSYRFGDAETEGDVAGATDATGVVAGATEAAADVAGLVAGGGVVPVTLAPGDAVEEPPGLAVAEPAGAGVPDADAPGTGVAEAAGTGVCPFVSSRVRLLPVFALRAYRIERTKVRRKKIAASQPVTLVSTLVVCAPKMFSVTPPPKAAPRPSLFGRCIRMTSIMSNASKT